MKTLSELHVEGLIYKSYANGGMAMLMMTPGYSCDMDSAVELCTNLDPTINMILTYSGLARDTTFERDDDGEWFAIPEDVARQWDS